MAFADAEASRANAGELNAAVADARATAISYIFMFFSVLLQHEFVVDSRWVTRIRPSPRAMHSACIDHGSSMHSDHVVRAIKPA